MLSVLHATGAEQGTHVESGRHSSYYLERRHGDMLEQRLRAPWEELKTPLSQLWKDGTARKTQRHLSNDSPHVCSGNARFAPPGATLTHGDAEEFLAGICNDVAVRQVFCIFLFIYSVAKNIKIASALLILLPGTLKTQKYILRETFCKEIRICCFL